MPLFTAHDRDRVQVFIDGQNTHGTIRALRKKINWIDLYSTFEADTRLIRMNYFTTIRPQQATDKFYNMLNFLEFNGYTLISKEVRDFMDEAGNVRLRGTVMVEMAISMYMAARNGTDHIFLFSGDSELCAAVQACKEEDTRVTVVSTPDVVSEELLRLADNFVSIKDFPASLLVDEKEQFDRAA